jgi:hypothetical protein
MPAILYSASNPLRPQTLTTKMATQMFDKGNLHLCMRLIPGKQRHTLMYKKSVTPRFRTHGIRMIVFMWPDTTGEDSQEVGRGDR